MVRLERRFDKKSAVILKYFEDFLSNLLSKMAVFCAALDQKLLLKYLKSAGTNAINIPLLKT